MWKICDISPMRQMSIDDRASTLALSAQRSYKVVESPYPCKDTALYNLIVFRIGGQVFHFFCVCHLLHSRCCWEPVSQGAIALRTLCIDPLLHARRNTSSCILLGWTLCALSLLQKNNKKTHAKEFTCSSNQQNNVKYFARTQHWSQLLDFRFLYFV